ncbi:hypothetical protein M8009_05040 [Halomonas sp. ATCH28]|uniref:Phage infection protein n=1 Tax=Halomonas gemina TaxID=2945105 RepID=A0ABT0SYJ4_9GAMM|nr:hypothetical protein [Halomonas gemina]MCL7939672.1 hypothetical protein [Halomonas gemina]
MRLKTLAAGMTLAFVGLAGSAAHAESGSLGVQTNSATDSTLDSQTGNDQFGVSSSTQVGVEVGVDGSTRTEREFQQQGELQTDTRAGSQTGAEHRGDAGVEGTLESATGTGHDTAAEASDRSRSVLEGASDTLEAGRETSEQWHEEATQASGQATGNLGTTAEAEGSANASGELR